MAFERKRKGDTLTTVSVRLTDKDLARLDNLVDKGYADPVDERAVWIDKSRGAAIRKAIRDAAKAQRVSATRKASS